MSGISNETAYTNKNEWLRTIVSIIVSLIIDASIYLGPVK